MLKPMPKNLFQPGLCAWPWPTARGVQPAKLRARDCAVGGGTGAVSTQPIPRLGVESAGLPKSCTERRQARLGPPPLGGWRAMQAGYVGGSALFVAVAD